MLLILLFVLFLFAFGFTVVFPLKLACLSRLIDELLWTLEQLVLTLPIIFGLVVFKLPSVPELGFALLWLFALQFILCPYSRNVLVFIILAPKLELEGLLFDVAGLNLSCIDASLVCISLAPIVTFLIVYFYLQAYTWLNIYCFRTSQFIISSFSSSSYAVDPNKFLQFQCSSLAYLLVVHFLQIYLMSMLVSQLSSWEFSLAIAYLYLEYFLFQKEVEIFLFLKFMLKLLKLLKLLFMEFVCTVIGLLFLFVLPTALFYFFMLVGLYYGQF